MRFLIASLAIATVALAGLSGCGKDEKEDLARRIVYHPGGGKDIRLEWTIKKLPAGDTALHGVMKEYYAGGANRKSVVYVDGLKDGSAQAWWEHGGQQWQKSYDKGKKARTWRLFYTDGNPWMVLAFNKEGFLEGTAQRWERDDPAQPKEAVFANGNCTSGDCNLLALPEATGDMPAANKLMVNRDREILADFLD
jgi:hypothetical protein